MTYPRLVRFEGQEPSEPPPPHDDEQGDSLPTLDELAEEQFKGAIARIHEDTSRYPEFPWVSLANTCGPMCPENLVMVMARTDVGKSTFLMNLFDALIESGRSGLYCGLEQSADVLRSKWAAMRVGVSAALILATKKHERGTPRHLEAQRRVDDELVRLHDETGYHDTAHFSRERRIDRAKLRLWTEWAVRHGCDFVVIDHIDRMDHGGRGEFHDISETVRLAKELAVKHRIVMLVASQVGRPRDPLEWFMPPQLHNMRGAGTKEEEADTVISLYRPLRPGVTTDDLKAVRAGLRNKDDVVEPNLTAAMLLKHRIDGPMAGRITRLLYQKGRYVDTRFGERCPLCGIQLAPIDRHPELCTACSK